MGYIPGGINLNAGSASYWGPTNGSTSSSELEITFLQPGDYEISLFTGSSGQTNSCGIDLYSQG